MKKLSLFVATAALIVFTAYAPAQTLATYNTTGIATNSDPTSLAATNVATNVTALAMTVPYGDYLNGLYPNSFGFYNNGTAITTLAGAVSAGSYFTFKVTPGSGHAINISGIDLSGYFGSQSYPGPNGATFYLEASVGSGFGSGSSNILAQWLPGNPGPGPGVISLSGKSAFQNVTGAVEFRIYVQEPNGYQQDAVGGGATGSDNSLVVDGTVATGAPAITSSLTASGTAGSAFNYQITASNSPTSYNATGLPNGLSVSTSTGVISGTPSTAGNSSVTLSATNSSGTGTATLAITVAAAGGGSGTLATYNTTGIATNSDPTSLAATNVATNVTALAMTVPYGDYLNGLYPNSFGFYNNGTAITSLAGAVSAGSYFTFKVTPASGYVSNISGIDLRGYFGSQSYPGPTGATFYLEASVGSGFGSGSSNILAQWLPGNPGPGPGVISLSGNSAFQNVTGAIEFRIYVQEPYGYQQDAVGGGATGTDNSLNVNGTVTSTGGGTAPVITSSTSASGTTGSAFNYQITASNSPTSYNATGLPNGLSVSSSTGVISGTPTTAGNSSVTLSATNSKGTGTAALALTISNPGTVTGISFLGTNLAGDWLFADSAKQANPTWYTYNSSNYQFTPATVDGSDWPTQDCALLVWQGVPSNDGTYLLSFTGKATISTFGGTSTVTSTPGGNGTPTTTGTFDGTNTTAYINITDTASENFYVLFTNSQRTSGSATNTGVTNVHLWRPTAEGASTSLGTVSSSSPGGSTGPLFGNDTITMSKYFSVTRFLDLLDVNNSSVSSWSGRTLPGAWNQNDEYGNGTYANGIAYEFTVAYCNASNTDLYLNIPANAVLDSSYATNLANLVKYGSNGVTPYTSTQSSPVYAPLNSNLHVYLEYGNEDWNGIFNAEHQIYSAVQADQSANNAEWAILNYDGLAADNLYQGAWRRVAYQLKLISDAFRAVYGNSAMPPNANAIVRPVIEFQEDNGQATGTSELPFINDYFNNADGIQHVATPHPINYFFWGGGGATYYNSGSYDGYKDTASSVPALFASGVPNPTSYNLTNNGYTFTVPGFPSAVQTDSALVKGYGLKRVAYEGGWGLNDQSPPNNITGGVIDQAKQSSGATTSQENAETTYQQSGGDLDIYYTSSNFSPDYIWNLVTQVNNLTTPLFQAIKALGTSAPAAVTYGNPISGTSATTLPTTSELFTVNSAGWGIPGYGWVPLVSTARNYQISINANSSTAGQKVVVLIDGQQVGGVVSVPVSGSAVNVVVATVNLTAGQHGLVVEGQYQTNGSYNSSGNGPIYGISSVVLTPQ